METTAKNKMGPFTIADGGDNIMGDLVSVDLLDANGFPVAAIPVQPILHNWPEKFPKMRHWADGAHDGRTSITRSEEELRGLANLFVAAPNLLDLARQLVAWNGDRNGDGIQLDKICRSAKKLVAAAEGSATE